MIRLLLLFVVPDPTVGNVRRVDHHEAWQYAIGWLCLVIGAVAFAILVAGSRGPR